MRKKRIIKTFWRQRQLFFLLLPGILFYAIFRYGPMYGAVIAFQDYNPWLGIENSPWVGLKHFKRLLTTPDLLELIRNTLRLGFLRITFVFVSPIIFALVLNEVRNTRFKKFYQTVSYLPSFLSVVIICGIFMDLFSVHGGLVNNIITFFGGSKIYFNGNPKYYLVIYILSDIWAGIGSGAIVYLAGLAGVDQNLYEAAAIDGCSRLKMIRYITIPSIMPTIVTMFLMNIGSIIRIGPDKTLILYNKLVLDTADILGSYVYRVGLLDKNYSFGSAVGLFESAIAAIILALANNICKRVTGSSLW